MFIIIKGLYICTNQNGDNARQTFNLFIMNNEKKFEENVSLFLQILKNFGGAPPTFSIQYRDNGDRRKGIYIVDCASGFIRDLQEEGAHTHLHNGNLTVDFF